MTKTTHLNKSELLGSGPTFPHSCDSLFVITDQSFMSIIRRKSFSIRRIVSVSRIRHFFNQPRGNIFMHSSFRIIQNKAKDNIFPFFAPAIQLIFFLNRFPIIDSFLRFQFFPCYIYMNKLSIFGDICFFR